MMKGWIDRVSVYGRMYRSAMRYDRWFCVGKKMLVCVTTGASADSCAYDGREGDTGLHLWPALSPFRYIGFDVLEPEILHGIGSVAFVEGEDDGVSGFEQFTQHWSKQLQHVGDRLITPYNRDSDFDANKRLRPEAPSYSSFVAHESSPFSLAHG